MPELTPLTKAVMAVSGGLLVGLLGMLGALLVRTGVLARERLNPNFKYVGGLLLGAVGGLAGGLAFYLFRDNLWDLATTAAGVAGVVAGISQYIFEGARRRKWQTPERSDKKDER